MRRKIKLAYIDNDSARRASFKKRSSGLMKKVRELTILCDVSACVIIYGPGEYDRVAVWPNEDEGWRLVQRFRSFPEMERRKKMVTQESYLRERAAKMSQQIQKLLRRNRETVLGLVMKKITAGKPLHELGDVELKGVMSMLDEKMEEITRRISCTENPAGIYLPPPNAEEIFGPGYFPPDRYQNHDFRGGFRDFGNGYMNGNGNKNNIIEGLVDEMEYEGNYNQEIVNNYARNVENVRLGFSQHGSGFRFGDNERENGVEHFNMLNFLNAGYGGGFQGFGNIGGNNVKAGNEFEEIDLAYETGKVVESDDSDEVPYNPGKHWPTFISPAL